MQPQPNDGSAPIRGFGLKSTPALTFTILGSAFIALAVWMSDDEWGGLQRDPLLLAARVGVFFPHAYVVALVMLKQIWWRLTVRDLYIVGMTYFFGSIWTLFLCSSLGR
jgi:hypothetical protein